MPNNRPNIILIVTDQQRFDTINALGYPSVETPNLDRLVKDGVSYSQCHVTAATCVPSRASLFNGYYPHTTGVLSNGDAWSRSWVEELNNSGYHCVNIGKMHTSPFDARAGFHERYIVENKERRTDFAGRQFFDELDVVLAARGLTRAEALNYRSRKDYSECLGAFEWPLEEEWLHHDVFVGNLASWWLQAHRERRSNDKPLFLQIGFPGPHPPYDPIRRYAEKYMQRDIPIAGIDQTDLDGQPTALKALREVMLTRQADSVVHQISPPDSARHRQRAYYLANVEMIDEQIGKIFAALDQQGYLDNAVIVFTSDHGDTLGDHGQNAKWTMYDEVTHVPLIFWGPGHCASGHNVQSLVQHFDVGPTILEFAQVAPAKSMEARSLFSSLQGGDEGRDAVFCEQAGDFVLQAVQMMTMIRTNQWKLVHFSGSEEGQLFELQTPEGENLNRWNDPDCIEIKADLLKKMSDWRVESQFHTSNWTEKFR